MFYEPTESYPSTTAQIGRWLGPAIDVGTAMTYKILKSNSWDVCRGAVRAWTPEKEGNPDLLKLRENVMTDIYDNRGRAAKPHDFLKGT